MHIFKKIIFQMCLFYLQHAFKVGSLNKNEKKIKAVAIVILLDTLLTFFWTIYKKKKQRKVKF